MSFCDFPNSQKAIHDKLVSLVDRMLELNKKENSLPPSAEREKIEREIAVTDEKIEVLQTFLWVQLLVPSLDGL